jgi:copper transport protein
VPRGAGGTATAVLVRPAPLRRDAHDGGTDPGPATVLASTVAVVSRFSTLAGVSVGVLLVAGFLLAIAEVGSVTNLFDTGYGQILLVKLALVGLLIAMAAYNRLLLVPVLHSVGRSPSAAGLGSGWRRLLATVRIEAIGVVAVLAVTAVLANSTPSNGATLHARPVPFAQTRPFEGGHLTLRITPNQALVNDFVVQFTDHGGAPADLAESVSVYLTLPSENVGPIETDMQKVGVGRFVLRDTPDPPIVGSWQITLQIQVSAFDEPDVGFVDGVR